MSPAWVLFIDPISRLLDQLITDPDARAKAQLELLKSERSADIEALRLALSADKNQTQINQQEARHTHLFVSGWRPFIGWVCGLAFCYHFIIQPILAFIVSNSTGDVVLPTFDMQQLSTVLMGMLGLGGLRTIEKIQPIYRKGLLQDKTHARVFFVAELGSVSGYKNLSVSGSGQLPGPSAISTYVGVVALYNRLTLKASQSSFGDFLTPRHQSKD